MEGDYISIDRRLLPLSWLYGAAVRLRNLMFDIGILKQHSFNLPVIAVGNITVGGTGKTPHVEFLIELLRHDYRLAVLSRGYKRRTSGFLVANSQTTAADIGDEPFQMKQKFSDICVAVDRNRVNGIKRLTAGDVAPEVVLLDDAFQHRYVKPGLSILLTDYHRLISYDELLPAGRLREPASGRYRADIVIVTKCPKQLKPMEHRAIAKRLALYPFQKLFFTTIDYQPLRPLFGNGKHSIDLWHHNESCQQLNVLLISGIASPQQLIDDLKPLFKSLQPATFADHHQFSANDIEHLNRLFDAMPKPRIAVTTEKDAARLRLAQGISRDLSEALYVIPMSIDFMLGQKQSFNETILSYVRKNSENSLMAQGKNDSTPPDSHHPGDRSRTISFRNN